MEISIPPNDIGDGEDLLANSSEDGKRGKKGGKDEEDNAANIGFDDKGSIASLQGINNASSF